jgi:lipoprotein-anchoring transpeptidase ErfK/SrfK
VIRGRAVALLDEGSDVRSCGGASLRTRSERAFTAALVASVMLATGCGGGDASQDPGSGPSAGRNGAATPPHTAAAIRITPANGTRGVRPDTKVTVTAAGGTITAIKVVDGDGTVLPGDMSMDSVTWTAGRLLGLGERHRVTAAVTDVKGRTTTATSTFTTLSVPRAKQLKASRIAPLKDSVVGIAQPLEVGFSAPVTNRAAVQRALRVEATPGVRGAWYWIDSAHVHFRPEAFWPAGAKITLHADITGVDAGSGRWGAADRTVSYTIGRQQIIRIDVKRLVLTVERNGKAVRRFRVTSGKKGWETRNGTKVIVGMETDKTWTNDAIDAPEDYTLHSDWAMRMTDSGEFIHDAAWSVGNLGRRSASHGCVGMRPADARWLYANTIVGDAVVVTGSPRPYGPIANRYGDWNVPWSTWSAGNA